ncbi:11257_t:CDS:2, partial [Rhizophagus irregularis]
THDKPDDSNDITDEAALATFDNTSSSTTVSRSIDTGMENKICIISGVKRVLEQNKEIYKAIHENKAAQESFRKEICEKIGNLSEKIEQLITPDDSYWKNLASRICKTQLPLLGLHPDELEFKKCFEVILEQEKPGYIKQHGSQWVHFYTGRIGPL